MSSAKAGTTSRRLGEPFIVVPLRYRKDHATWSNAEVAAWLDLLLVSYQTGGVFDSPIVARAYLGGRAGALDALMDRGAFRENEDGDWQLADYTELYDSAKQLRPYLPNAVRAGDAQAKLERGEPLTEAERKALQRSKAPEQELETDQEERESKRASPDVSGHVPEPPRGCPECDGTLIRKVGRRGEFISCDQYPHCRYSEELPKPKGWVPTAADLAVIEEAHREGAA